MELGQTEVKEEKDGGRKLQKEEQKPPAFMTMEANYSIKAVGGAEFFFPPPASLA